jgi:hypothetical protein
VAHWLQHTSRDGDMQLHIHSQIAKVARTTIDGKWRAPDSLGYNEHIGAVAAMVSQHLEEALTRWPSSATPRPCPAWTARNGAAGTRPIRTEWLFSGYRRPAVASPGHPQFLECAESTKRRYYRLIS